jgi:hypothetical protein
MASNFIVISSLSSFADFRVNVLDCTLVCLRMLCNCFVVKWNLLVICFSMLDRNYCVCYICRRNYLKMNKTVHINVTKSVIPSSAEFF